MIVKFFKEEVKPSDNKNLAIANRSHEFLFAFHCNYGDILYRLQDIATYW